MPLASSLFDPRDPSWGPPPARCGDCGVTLEGFHHPGCDLARCPACGGQLLSCGCPFDEFPVGLPADDEEFDWILDDAEAEDEPGDAEALAAALAQIDELFRRGRPGA